MRKPDLQPVYLSPHLDDAALSCGGLIHKQVRQGAQPLVITCLAGVPDYEALSPLAEELHRSWGRQRDLVEHRRCENATAMAYLGARYEHWDYLDCIYRRHPSSGEFLYASLPALFGDLHMEEHSLVADLATRLLASLPAERTQTYAPLAVGHHIDHQLVFQAALELRRNGVTVRFYEDYPYAEHSESLQEALAVWSSAPTPAVEALEEEDVEAKIASIRHYRSQLDELFGGESFMIEQVRAYAAAVGSGQGHGERYWEGGSE
jgi:LmbE family N-acetylglucosaminyl deacetylase